MKSIRNLFFMLFISTAFVFSACSKDDPEGPDTSQGYTMNGTKYKFTKGEYLLDGRELLLYLRVTSIWGDVGFHFRNPQNQNFTTLPVGTFTYTSEDYSPAQLIYIGGVIGETGGDDWPFQYEAEKGSTVTISKSGETYKVDFSMKANGQTITGSYQGAINEF